jgi:hypothetical protein
MVGSGATWVFVRFRAHIQFFNGHLALKRLSSSLPALTVVVAGVLDVITIQRHAIALRNVFDSGSTTSLSEDRSTAPLARGPDAVGAERMGHYRNRGYHLT